MRRKREQSEVEMNMAAMLDMAFQLLTFFILTFRPAPIEGQLSLNLPPPVPATRVESPPAPATGNALDEPLSLDVLHLQISADSEGDVQQVLIEGAPIVAGPLNQDSLPALEQQLRTIFNIPDVPYDRVQIAVDARLNYGELMKVVDLCARQKLPDGSHVSKISFNEL